MVDEPELLAQSDSLFGLLGRYHLLWSTGADTGTADAWQDRVMAIDDLPAREITRLHGELLAYGWVEQNTGNTPVLKPGVAAACYRVTPAGRKAFKHARAARAESAGRGGHDLSESVGAAAAGAAE